MKCINYELIEQYAKRLKDGDDPIEKAFEMYEYVGGIVFDGVPIDTVLEIIDDVFMGVANGLIHTPSEALEETHNRVKTLRGEQ